MIQLASKPFVATPRHSSEENDQLADEIAELAAHLHAATYRLLTLLREYDAREAWGGASASLSAGRPRTSSGWCGRGGGSMRRRRPRRSGYATIAAT